MADVAIVMPPPAAACGSDGFICFVIIICLVATAAAADLLILSQHGAGAGCSSATVWQPGRQGETAEEGRGQDGL